MHKDGILVIGIIIVIVILLCVAIHFLARFVSARRSIAVEPIIVRQIEQHATSPKLGKGLQLTIGVFCFSFGGLWCMGLFLMRVDPPEVAMANAAAVIAAGIVALGIKLIGKAMIAGSTNEGKRKVILLGFVFVVWLGLPLCLAAWHQIILRVRETQAKEMFQRMQKERREPLPSAPLVRAAEIGR